MDALALRAEEGRRQQRKAPVRCLQSMTRRYPNGATPQERYLRLSDESIVRVEASR